MTKLRKTILIVSLGAVLLCLYQFLRTGDPISESRFVEPDKLFKIIEANIRSHTDFELIADIDHSRLAAAEGVPMPPSHVLIWSDPRLDAAIIKNKAIAAVDLPLRVLVYEDPHTREPVVMFNSYDYIAQRHEIPEDESIRNRYESAMSTALKNVPTETIRQLPASTQPSSGLLTLQSPYELDTTEERILNAINVQSDTVIFGKVDFTQRSKEQGVTTQPIRLILFGGPAPGGKAMKSAPALGLDAFCQKLLIWQDANGNTQITWNDLPSIAKRHQVSSGLALKVINYRLKKTFSTALEQ